ncbi:TonB-dependent receptor [Sphingomonas prati]|uniref:TonB-dependent receptor n=2 Tax=Sphingomonas prati TaxID=1843237 RepID=A0A7W9BU61_9SPHN|nr:TonB-dependent receptor [Sphingomonas prati]MBB5730191.1 TonB-dependent receptor [Sphingomonas prati]GGE92255.1 TonB-dependent receptor [Sphingomonas prati]
MVIAMPALAQPGGIDQNAPATNAQPGAENAPAVAQVNTPADAGTTGDEIVITGVRASLNRAIDIKRNSAGVVDAISAEDIGKFPDTNLAESLQRITGVSINRVNGEGSQVAVRGFSGGFNLVTVNGRQLPASNVDTSGGNAFARGTGRSFDFQNLASEGVSTLEVYKTGRSSIPSGGIGATINIITRKPLDAKESGFNGSIGAKALYDTSVEDAESKKRRATPEVSGVLSWTNTDQTFGASLFGSYQLRHSTSVSSTPNYWNVVPTSTFFGSDNAYVSPTTQITNRPGADTPYVLIPNDSRYAFSENRRERINAQGVLQFKPSDRLEFTVDGLFAQNKLSEQRAEQTNWFNRPFDQVTFDTGKPFASALILQRNDDGTKDNGFEQQSFATETQLKSFGANAKWEFADNLTLTLDGHHSTSKTTPDNPNGTSATLVSLAAPVGQSQSVDFTSGFPQQSITINDSIKGNGNGILDLGDLGTQVGRTVTAQQRQRINEGRVQLGWDLGEGSRFDFGGNYIDQKMNSRGSQTQQALGDWGVGDTGIISQQASDLVQTYCLTCKFDKFNPNSSGASLTAFRGNAVDLNNLFSPYYASRGNPVNASGSFNDTVGEKTWAVFGQLTWDGEIAGHRANLLMGARYEQTRVRANSLQAVPTAIIWQSDNDFFVNFAGTDTTPVSGRGKYSNLLPAVDFNIEVVRNVKARASFSKTLARPDFGNLFASATVVQPPRPTTIGGVATGTSQNPNLQPLISDNFDVSVEWYYKPSSFVSVGFFDKRVKNFIGTGIVSQNLFGLRDPSSGAAGSRSGTAREQLALNNFGITDVNLFSYTALLAQNGGNVAAATATLLANSNNGVINPDFATALFTGVDVTANAQDPLFNFAVSQPLNNREGKIHGFEVAWTNFFGNSGFGYALSFTKVSGNVNVDPYADPTVNIFALTGLGDSANATAIYDKNGLSARVSYNWRAKYLSATNVGDGRNPTFTAAFGTLDANISYDINEKFAVSLEGINLTSESVRTYARTKENLVFAQELRPRILIGGRYRF